MTIYRWGFATPFHVLTTDMTSLIRHLKTVPATEVKVDTEEPMTPPFFNGEQVLRTFLSKRAGEGVVGKLTITNRDRRHPVLVVEDFQRLDHRFAEVTERPINRDNLLVAISQGDGRRGLLIHSVMAYSPKGERDGFWQRKR